MNWEISNLFGSALEQRIGWALLHFLWQGAAVAALLGVALQFLHHKSAQARYVAACIALGMMAVLPIVTAAFISPTIPSTARTEMPATISDASPVPASPEITPIARTASEPLANPRQALSALPDKSAPNAWREALLARLTACLPWAVIAWAFGVSAMALRQMVGWLMLRRMRTLGQPLSQPALAETFERLKKRLAVSLPVRLLESALVQTPTVIGWLRPVILLPATALSGLSADQIEAILAHELAHIRRWDCLARMIQATVETLLFFHPAVWWVSARMTQESEHCCDESALEVCKDKKEYARALAMVAGAWRPNGSIAPAATGGKLLPRLHRILGRSDARSANRTVMSAAVTSLLAAVVIVTPLACSMAKTAQPPATAAPVAAVAVKLSPVKATITIYFDNDKNLLPRKKIMEIDDPRLVATLCGFFPEMDAGKKSPSAGAWAAGATIDFLDADGGKMHIAISANDGMKTWSEGQGDWAVRGDFNYYLQVLQVAVQVGLSADCETGTPQEVRAQIRAGADVNEDENGCTPLMTAALHNANPEVISVLVSAGAKVNARGKCAEAQATWRDVSHEHVDIIEKLTAAESQDNAGWTALLCAAMQNPNPEVVRALVKAGADVNDTGYCGCTAAILAAARNPNPEVAAALGRAGADMNVVDQFGYTPLMWAVGRNPNPKMIFVLAEAGAKIDQTDREGRTALMGATDNKSPAVIAALVKAGADISIKDNQGRDVMDYARRYGDDSMPVKALEKAIHPAATQPGESGAKSSAVSQ